MAAPKGPYVGVGATAAVKDLLGNQPLSYFQTGEVLRILQEGLDNRSPKSSRHSISHFESIERQEYRGEVR